MLTLCFNYEIMSHTVYCPVMFAPDEKAQSAQRQIWTNMILSTKLQYPACLCTSATATHSFKAHRTESSMMDQCVLVHIPASLVAYFAFHVLFSPHTHKTEINDVTGRHIIQLATFCNYSESLMRVIHLHEYYRMILTEDASKFLNRNVSSLVTIVQVNWLYSTVSLYCTSRFNTMPFF